MITSSPLAPYPRGGTALHRLPKALESSSAAESAGLCQAGANASCVGSAELLQSGAGGEDAPEHERERRLAKRMRMMDTSSSPTRQSSLGEDSAPSSQTTTTASVTAAAVVGVGIAPPLTTVGSGCVVGTPAVALPGSGALGSANPSSGASSQPGGGNTGGSGTGAGTYHFKILVPSVAAGAIIGKGGETIAALQKECGARVKMSKSNDFYPGTSERVCLITGSVEGIMRIHNFVMDKIKVTLSSQS